VQERDGEPLHHLCLRQAELLHDVDEIAHALDVARERVVGQETEARDAPIRVEVPRRGGVGERAVTLHRVGHVVQVELETRMRPPQHPVVELAEVLFLTLSRGADVRQIETAVGV